MRRVLYTAPAALVLVVAIAGCATPGGTEGAPGSTATVPSGTTAPPPGSLTLDGVAEKGVEPGCLVLRAGSKNYLLLQGADPVSATGVPVGVPVRVTGDLLTGVASYCQQGAPFRVDTVTRR